MLSGRKDVAFSFTATTRSALAACGRCRTIAHSLVGPVQALSVLILSARRLSAVSISVPRVDFVRVPG